MTSRRVVAATGLEEAQMGAGFRTRSLRPGSLVLDPFLSVDEFHMSVPTFPPHPHAGFSAVTYMLEDSSGAFINRDSLGDRSRIAPGALHWTQAARGMMHEEVPERSGVDCHGLQMFVNLRGVDKRAAPRAFHLEPEQVPVTTSAGVRVRVLAGSAADATSPLGELLTDALLLDVQLQPATRLSLELPARYNVFAVAIAGEGLADEHGATISARRGSDRQAVGYSREGDRVVLTTQGEPLHVVIAGGVPLGEPVVFGGPFAMTTAEEVADAFARHRRGEMGRLAPSSA
jgi:redox-sensitive bicupin YhaK (pirin superfamily)